MEEKVYFETSDGLKLCGILSLPQNNTQKCIVLCHGIGYHKDEDENRFKEFTKKLIEAGYAVFRFDFRGHGESGGKSVDMTVAGEEKDVEAAVEFVKSKGFSRFAVLACSFAGGAVSLFASKYKDDNSLRALVFWAPVIDYEEMLNPTFPWEIKYWGKPAFERVEKFGFTEVGSRKLKVGKGLMNEIQTLKPWKELLKISIPALFVHGDNDHYVKVEDSIKYSAMMRNAKLVIISGAEHVFSGSPEFAEQADRTTINFLLRNM